MWNQTLLRLPQKKEEVQGKKKKRTSPAVLQVPSLGLGLIPGLGTKIPHVMGYGPKKKKESRRASMESIVSGDVER